jgi:hypothetical protein
MGRWRSGGLKDTGSHLPLVCAAICVFFLCKLGVGCWLGAWVLRVLWGMEWGEWVGEWVGLVNFGWW